VVQAVVGKFDWVITPGKATLRRTICKILKNINKLGGHARVLIGKALLCNENYLH